MAYDAQVTEKSADMIVLERARDYMARHGHCQHAAYGDNGEVCIYAACVAGSPDWHGGASGLDYLIGPDWLVFSDAPGRTLSEVLARFDTAIAKLAAAQ